MTGRWILLVFFNIASWLALLFWGIRSLDSAPPLLVSACQVAIFILLGWPFAWLGLSGLAADTFMALVIVNAFFWAGGVEWGLRRFVDPPRTDPADRSPD